MNTNDTDSKTFDFLSLDLDLQCQIFELLSIRDVAAVSKVCKEWCTLSNSDDIWERLLRRDFGSSDPATLAGVMHTSSTPREAYKRLARKQTCVRCASTFTDGSNSPETCTFHSGLLFSGGLINGAALRFTCCNRRAAPTGSRDANGCKTCYHVACAGSYWMPEGRLGAAPSAYIPGDVPLNPKIKDKSPCRARGATTSRSRAVEWHPDKRPGLIELPSRLLLPTTV